MPNQPPRIEDEPFDRLTEIAGRLIEHYESTVDHEPGDKLIVFVEDCERTGLAVSGFDCIHEVASSLITHLMAIFDAMGKRMDLMSVDDDGEATLVSTNHEPTKNRETN